MNLEEKKKDKMKDLVKDTEMHSFFEKKEKINNDNKQTKDKQPNNNKNSHL